MRSSRLLSTLPYANIAAALLILALTIWLFITGSSHSWLSWCVFIGTLAAIALSPKFPFTCSIVLLCIDPISYVISADVEFIMFAVLLGIGLLAYKSTNVIAFCIVFLMSSIQLVEMLIQRVNTSDDIMLYPSFIVIDALAALIGCALRWNEEQFEKRRQAEREAAEAERMRANERIARDIHDSVTADLSFIVRKARLNPDDTDLRQIGDMALQALGSVHEVIDRLDGGAEDTAQETDADLQTAITRIMEQGQRRLNQIGITGTANFRVGPAPASLNPQCRKLSEGVLGELFANLTRHCPPTGTYQLTASWERDGIRITVVNDFATDVTDMTDATGTVDDTAPTDAQDPSFPGGTGLERYRDLLKREHGDMTITRMDGQWAVFVFIPGRQTEGTIR